jgi:hypothetical protein
VTYDRRAKHTGERVTAAALELDLEHGAPEIADLVTRRPARVRPGARRRTRPPPTIAHLMPSAALELDQEHSGDFDAAGDRRHGDRPPRTSSTWSRRRARPTWSRRRARPRRRSPPPS